MAVWLMVEHGFEAAEAAAWIRMAHPARADSGDRPARN